MKTSDRIRQEDKQSSQKVPEKSVLEVSDNMDAQIAERQRFRLDEMKKASELTMRQQK